MRAFMHAGVTERIQMIEDALAEALSGAVDIVHIDGERYLAVPSTCGDEADLFLLYRVARNIEAKLA